jgi:hypothetical protein
MQSVSGFNGLPVSFALAMALLAASAIQISELRSTINSSSFLQVTATPYFLYLQPTEIEVANVLAFKPTRPAFTRLVPVG